jgi:hypothetical protein
VARFWSPERNLFINNLPWLSQEAGPRTCDRSLSTAILFEQCPGGRSTEALRELVECPPEMGFSYPANACWRLWALARYGRGDVIVADLRKRWAPMESVLANNTLQEEWHSKPDSNQQWSHCAVVPLYMAFHGLMGLRPLEPGFRRFEVRPQTGDIESLDLTAFTVQGPVSMRSRKGAGRVEVTLGLPPGGQGELVLPDGEAVGLPEAQGPAPPGHRRYRLPRGGPVTLLLKHGPA